MEKKLYRKKDGAMISGVMNGLAEYLGIDVSLLRVIYVVLALLTTGIPFVFIYIMMAIIMPEESEIGFDDYEVE